MYVARITHKLVKLQCITLTWGLMQSVDPLSDREICRTGVGPRDFMPRNQMPPASVVTLWSAGGGKIFFKHAGLLFKFKNFKCIGIKCHLGVNWI